jgi:carboxyl-terminal processing protease
MPVKNSFARKLVKFSLLAGVAASLAYSGYVFAEEKKAKDKTVVKNNPEDTLKMLDLFGDIFDKVRKEYVEEPSDKQLVEAALNGMLTNLDPHSSFLNEEAFADMQVQTKGEFGGLGIEVTMKNGLVYVVSPIDDTPAFHAGIKAADYISHINSESVMGLTVNDAVKRMRGKPGDPITLTIVREGKDEPFDVTLVRDVIRLKSVKFNAEGDVGYVRITNFSENTEEGLEKAVADLKKQIGKEFKGIVLDLRNNPGGLLNQAVAVSDAFLEKGEIVSTRGREASNTQRFNATKGDLLDGLPLVVLINGGSASASEIVSGALQDHHRAIVLGTKSFGKGSVQTVIPVKSPVGGKESAIRITTARYYTPSGKSIQAEGIVPDIEVPQGKLELTEKSDDKKFSEASLRGHLTNEDDKKSSEKPEDKKPANDDKPKDSSDKEDKKDEKSSTDNNKDDKKGVDAKKDKTTREKDYQLGVALDFLRGLWLYKRDINNVANAGNG